MPSGEETPAAPEPPAAVTVIDAAPVADGTTDGQLAILMELQAGQIRLEQQVQQLAEVAYTADMKASQAIDNDQAVLEQVAEVAADVEEALEEEQAPASADEEPKKQHWLHR